MIIHKLYCGLCDVYREASPEETGFGREPMVHACHKCHQPMTIVDSNIECDQCKDRVPFRDSAGWYQLSQSIAVKDPNNWGKAEIILVHFCNANHYVDFMERLVLAAKGISKALDHASAPKLQILEGELVD